MRFSGDRTTQYQVLEAMGETALCAMSDGSASALVMKAAYLPADYPILRFRVFVEGPVEGGDVFMKEGDDFAARIFVNFSFDRQQEGWRARLKHYAAEKARGTPLPGHALNYVWGNVAPIGTEVPSAYTDRVQMIVVSSGRAAAGSWVEFERNIVSDYTAAFGKTPPPVVAIGVMTDTDDTGGRAQACFGEIHALPEMAPQDNLP